MSLLMHTCACIRSVDHEAARQTQKLLDEKTKPHGSLGMLEQLACRLAAIGGRAEGVLDGKAVVVMAADHGVAEEGVSAYPAEVTEQMVANFAHGGAAINVLARQAKAQVVVVNMGTKRRGVEIPCIRDAWLGPGTANFAQGPAMTMQQALQGVDIGIQLATELCAAGIGLIGVGEMGIGNTTAASAMTAVFTGDAPERVTGRGTGIDEATWKRKVDVIEKALAIHQPRRDQPLEVLARVGGFELAGLAGVMLGAAAQRVPIVLDGFITGAAALAAVGLCPLVRDYLIASHQSVEPGHRRILDHLELRPLFNLDMRLGEGTGAVLAMYLIEASLRIVREMATFRSDGITTSFVG